MIPAPIARDLVVGGLALLAGLALGALLLGGERASRPEKPVEPRFQATRFERLDGWTADDQAAALEAFKRSCARLGKAADDSPVGPYGEAKDWRGACALADTVAAGDTPAARRFFEAAFVPVAVKAGRRRQGLFTGYYEAALEGSRTPSERYAVPLLSRPADLVMVNLGAFREALKGQRIAGRVEEGRLLPYAERAALETAARQNPSGETTLLWVDDPVDAYFLQIQGSGRVRLETGETVRVNYDGQNGHPVTMIGGILVKEGALDKKTVSMQSIRDWLAANPDEAPALLARNLSTVFFRELPVEDAALGPPGAEGVALTPGRSLAVDLAVHGLGVPMWVEAEPPGAEPPGADLPAAEAPLGRTPVRRLMIAQDTGGAIRGAVRGDVFWGFGDTAAALAGPMKSRGRLVVLLPPAVAESLLGRKPS